MSAALDALLILWLEHPMIAVAFCGICLIVAWRFVFLSRIRIVQRDQQQNAEIAYTVSQRALELRLTAEQMDDKEVA